MLNPPQGSIANSMTQSSRRRNKWKNCTSHTGWLPPTYTNTHRRANIYVSSTPSHMSSIVKNQPDRWLYFSLFLSHASYPFHVVSKGVKVYAAAKALAYAPFTDQRTGDSFILRREEWKHLHTVCTHYCKHTHTLGSKKSKILAHIYTLQATTATALLVSKGSKIQAFNSRDWTIRANVPENWFVGDVRNKRYFYTYTATLNFHRYSLEQQVGKQMSNFKLPSSEYSLWYPVGHRSSDHRCLTTKGE